MENYYSTKGIHTQCTVGKHFLAIGHSTCWDDWIVRLRASLNTSFERRLSGEALGLAKALLLGNTADVNEETKKSFSATGAIHVLAVSGMHISLFAALILYSFRCLLMGIRRAWAILIALIILWSYAWLTGFSPSVIRAVTMFTLVNLGQLTQRTGNANYNLFWCGFLMYLFDPMCIFDIGFQLSFSAVYGIQTYKDRITSWWNPKSKLLRLMWEHSSIAIAAQLFTVPLILYYFHSFPNYFLIANLGIVVLSGLAMYLGFGFLLLGWIPLIGHLLGFLFSCALQLMNWFIFSIASLPGAVEEGFSFSHWALICLIIFLFAILHSKLAIWQKCLAGLLILSGLSYNRYIHQMETHLMILQAKRPILIHKRKTHITLFYSPYETKNSLHRVLADYQKIYPCKSIVTHKLPNQTTINLKNAEIIFGTKQLTMHGNTTYRIYFQSNGNWYLHDANHVKKIEAGCKLAF
ncbi:MAG: ComEC/Rec2 family competence protein [Flavobacteriales bacterium]